MFKTAKDTYGRIFFAMRAVSLLSLLFMACLSSCSSSTPLPTVEFGQVTDALGGDGPTLDLIEGLPAMFLVGEPEDFEVLVRERSALSSSDQNVVTLIACPGMNDLAFTALSDQALEAALDDGGSILLDRNGGTATALRQGSHEMMKITIDANRTILTSSTL